MSQSTDQKDSTEAEQQPNKITQRLFIVDGLPIRYLVIPKCGCTYVKNVLWRLKNGHDHTKPLRVHDDDSHFRRASDLGLLPDDIAKEEYAFTVVRKPIGRFLSLYFDKVIGPGRKNYVPLASTLIAKRGLIEQPATIAEHQKNLAILIGWLADNLETGVDLPKEAHWTPQMYRQNIINKCNLKLLLVEDLEAHLRFLLHGVVDDIDQTLGSAEKNESPKSLSRTEILNDELRARIDEVYAKDKRIYQRTRKAWRTIDLAQPNPLIVPRYQDVN